MRATTLLILLCAVLLAGCSDDWVTNELDAASGAKTRPFSIVCEPPDAAPGETVTVTFRYYEPAPEAQTVTWRLALDYTDDIYEEQEIEAHIVDLHEIALISDPVVDAEGVAVQTFEFVVPENTLLVSNGLEPSYDLDLPAGIEALFDPAVPGRLTKQELDAFFSTCDPGDYDEATLAVLREIVGYFACQIRLRVRLRGGTHLDVTKNMTVRYSGRLGGGNVNRNPVVERVALLSVHKRDVDDFDDVAACTVDTTCVYHRDPAQISTEPIAVDPDWTYYLLIEHETPTYISPAGIEHDEDYDYNWYFIRTGDNPGAGLFIVGEDGEETEMFELDEYARILPPVSPEPKTFRVMTTVRNHRYEWEPFNGTPGCAFVSLDLEFVNP